MTYNEFSSIIHDCQLSVTGVGCPAHNRERKLVATFFIWFETDVMQIKNIIQASKTRQDNPRMGETRKTWGSVEGPHINQEKTHSEGEAY